MTKLTMTTNYSIVSGTYTPDLLLLQIILSHSFSAFPKHTLAMEHFSFFVFEEEGDESPPSLYISAQLPRPSGPNITTHSVNLQ